MDDPFTTIDAYVTSVTSHTTTFYSNGALRNVSRIADTKLSDLGVSSTSDIIDTERQLLAPTAMVPRLYIGDIDPGETYEVSFRLRADSHMVEGRPYREYVLLEYIDSDGLIYRYDEANPQLSTKPLPIIIHTRNNDEWPKDDTAWSETLAILLIIIIVIIIIVLLLSSVFQKRRAGEADQEDREFKPRSSSFPDDEEDEEDEEDDFPPPQDEEEPPMDEEPEDEEPDEDEEDDDWAEDDKDKEDDEEPDVDEDEEQDDWAISETEEKKKPAKGKMPVKGKVPEGKSPKGKGPDTDVDDEDLDDWD
jgi:hypothetical protein